MKNTLKNLLAGIFIGIGSAIPGVSGGTIAVILKVYEKIIWAVSHLFKEFKKAIVILLPVIIGLVIGIVPTIILMDKALEGFLFGVVCIFAGFIAGSLPKISKEIKGKKFITPNTITFVIALVVAVGLGIASVLSKSDVGAYINNPPIWLYFVLIPVGFIASIALVVPGISGGMVLILCGFYKPLIESTTTTLENLVHGDASHLGIQVGILGCFAIGVLVGFFVVSKLMSVLLEKYHDITFSGILGFVIGSVVALFINFEIWEYYTLWSNGGQGYLRKEIEIPLGISLLILAMVLSYLLTRYEDKHQPVEAQD